MNFITPGAEELSYLRTDPLLWEQELDVRPDVAEAIERATGVRAGRVYWRSEHDHLYALELADLGRGRPSMAMVSGHWDRYEPRPPEHEIDADLLAFSIWVAEVAESLNPADFAKVAQFAGVRTSWPEGTVLRTPEERFANLPGFTYEPKYIEVEGLRMAYVEAGSGDPILMLHGEPTWGYLYRHMIPPLAEVGRVVVPDLIGFGRSDKPATANVQLQIARSLAAQIYCRARSEKDYARVSGLGRVTRIASAGTDARRIHTSGGNEYGHRRRARA